MLFTSRFVYVALTQGIASELIKYLEKNRKMGLFDNNHVCICLNCQGNFIANGQICQCYEILDEHFNYIFAIKDDLLGNIEEIFKKLIEKEKFKKLRINRNKSLIEASGSFNGYDITRLYEIQSGLCYYCMKELNKKYEIDHIEPLSSGGSNWPLNLALACKECNLKKSWTSESFFLKKIRSTRSDTFRSGHISFLAKVRYQKRKIFKD